MKTDGRVWPRISARGAAAKAAATVAPPPVSPKPVASGEDVTWREMAGGLAALLSPAAALGYTLALWRLGQDMGFAGSFFIAEGPLSHWQVWFVGASLVLAAVQWLNRRARGPDEPATG